MQDTPTFRTSFSRDIFASKYAHEEAGPAAKPLKALAAKENRTPMEQEAYEAYAELHWTQLAKTLARQVAGPYLTVREVDEIARIISGMGGIPGGRYLYYAGRKNKFYNNCFLLKAEEDTREEWGALMQRATACLMTGGGIGIDYSILRERGAPLKRTGGIASGPVPLMQAVNEIGRRVQQGGSRRSAIYASLNWQHPDINEFIHAKDWYDMPVGQTGYSIGDLKEQDFNYPAPLDMTNISPNYDNAFLEKIYGKPFAELKRIYETEGRKGIMALEISYLPPTFVKNMAQALKTGEPGFSFNFFEKVLETLRNACTEVTSEDDSDVCNLASMNMAAFDSIEDFRSAVRLMTKFLVCGTLEADLPYGKVYEVREKNRRLGLGLMGIHEWLMKRGYRYEVVPELHKWLKVYEEESRKAAYELCDQLGISRPVAICALAPTGTIGIMAGTTTGMEPMFAVAFSRRYLKGEVWHKQYVIDGTAKAMIREYGIQPDKIETALDLAGDFERRVKFQYDIQAYVDQSISSTINMPSWGDPLNNESTVEQNARILAKYAHGLRGFTCYPNGARGGQPLTSVPYSEAQMMEGMEFKEEAFDVCDLTKGGTCGL